MSSVKKAPRSAARRTSPKKRPTKATVSRSGKAGKAEGDAAARRWIADVQPSHRPLVEAIDAIVAREVPHVKRAIKWSSLHRSSL
jgi:hypothetical protein